MREWETLLPLLKSWSLCQRSPARFHSRSPVVVIGFHANCDILCKFGGNHEDIESTNPLPKHPPPTPLCITLSLTGFLIILVYLSWDFQVFYIENILFRSLVANLLPPIHFLLSWYPAILYYLTYCFIPQPCKVV